MDGQKRTFTYIPHLDGLRALSVFAILAFHLRPDLLPGGFLGVDIFFIISGFLITGLFLDEVQNYGRIDISRFYLRRFKRLFPSFVLVILASLVAAYAFLDELKFISVAKTAIMGVFGLSNLYFFKTANYFDLSSIEKPLLHIWSLNVEEQFYFVWPFIFFTTYKLILRRPVYFLVPVSILFLISVYTNLNHPVATFYLPFFRFYEFLIGACVAIFPWRKPAIQRNVSTFLVASFVVLSLTILNIDSTSFMPGPSSLLFIIPTVYLIVRGGMKSRLNFLEIYFVRYIGKRSYTIYLIHWPVIVFYLESNSGQKLSAPEALFLSLITLLVSDIVYRFFETPMRNAHNKSRKFWISMFALLFTVLTICAPTLILDKKPLSHEGGLIYSQSDIAAGKQLRFSTRIKIREIKGWEKCDFPRKNKFNILIMGDSHAVDALNAVYANFPNFDYSMSQLGGCPPTDRMTQLVPRTFPDLDNCVKLNVQRYDIEYLRKFDAIVINVLFGWYESRELENYLLFLHKSEIKKVVVFGGYFETKSDVPEIINEHGYDKTQISAQIIQKKVSDESLKKVSNELDYFFVSKKQILCEKNDCLFWKSRVPYTWDNHHLSFEFSHLLLGHKKNELSSYLVN